ncbi:hypothetical protein LUA82_03355 [Neoehrlichia mikurensis]|uniref:Uncharacterized protein n=1 Tax=Neoehrlichia mikurensis TaxID=89586 RepID=A0A9Q9F4J8_9RICK|nr:hypothetical protein [Neoehrlichia mikurensis]UTO55206.1 hypothetical protein LUA82_03355 [Neoehrlichia mikurensis]
MSHSNNDIDNTNYWDIILSSNTIYEMTSYSSKNSRIEELLRISCDLYVNNIHINTHQLIDIYNQGFSSHEIYQVIHELFGDSSAYKALLPKNYENVYSNTLYKSHKDHLQAYLILKKTLANIGITAHKNIINELLYNITVGNLGAFIENNIAQPLLKIIKNVYELGKVDDVYSHISRVSYVINISIPKNKNSATIQCIAKSNIISLLEGLLLVMKHYQIWKILQNMKIFLIVIQKTIIL